MVEELVAAGEAAGIKRDPASLKKQRPLIKALLKANIGMALYGDRAFYDSYLPYDDDLRQVREQQ